MRETYQRLRDNRCNVVTFLLPNHTVTYNPKCFMLNYAHDNSINKIKRWLIISALWIMPMLVLHSLIVFKKRIGPSNKYRIHFNIVAPKSFEK